MEKVATISMDGNIVRITKTPDGYRASWYKVHPGGSNGDAIERLVRGAESHNGAPVHLHIGMG